ncbi:MAG: twin-arginine translocase TatA/TatE family subunit [Candidatus Woesearchaeota archaeon]
MIGLWEIIGILLIVAIIYFIGKKAPGLARNTGRSISEFKQGIKNIPEEVKKGMEEQETKNSKKKAPVKKKKTTKKKTTKKK